MFKRIRAHLRRLIAVLVFGVTPSVHADELLNQAKAILADKGGALIKVEALWTAPAGKGVYGLVQYQEYTNGACRPRGTCGCGVEVYLLSIPPTEHVRTGSCGRSLSGGTSDHLPFKAILVDDLKASCETDDATKGMSFYLYDQSSPEKGIQTVDRGRYEAVTGKSVVPPKPDNIAEDKCFFDRHFLMPEPWGGATSSNLVYEKVRAPQQPPRIGRLLGHYRDGKFLSLDETDAIPVDVYNKTTKLRDEISMKYKNASQSTFRSKGVAHFRKGEYELAEVYYQLAVIRFYNDVWKTDASVANDLALSQYKQAKYDAAESWAKMIVRYERIKDYAKHAAAANYNLGLIAEARKRPEAAIAFYTESNKLRPTKAAAEALARLRQEPSQ